MTLKYDDFKKGMVKPKDKFFWLRFTLHFILGVPVGFWLSFEFDMTIETRVVVALISGIFIALIGDPFWSFLASYCEACNQTLGTYWRNRWK